MFTILSICEQLQVYAVSFASVYQNATSLKKAVSYSLICTLHLMETERRARAKTACSMPEESSGRNLSSTSGYAKLVEDFAFIAWTNRFESRHSMATGDVTISLYKDIQQKDCL